MSDDAVVTPDERVHETPTTERVAAITPMHGDRPAPAAIRIGSAIAQAKLSVGPAGDRFEREADQVADRVVRSLRPGTVDAPSYDDSRGRRAPSPIPHDSTAISDRRIRRSAMSITQAGVSGTIQRKSTTPKCTQADLDDVNTALGHIRDGRFDPAMDALPNLKYKPSDKPGLMKRSAAAHQKAGLDTLENLKNAAKTLAPKDASAHATTAIAAIATAMNTASIDDVVRIGCKVAHNLMAATLRSLLAAEKKGDLDEHLHHGTSSAILGSFTGELLSQKELDKRGITRRTGEGNALSGVDDLKDEVFVGMGKGGGGTSAGYATASGKLAEYNLDLLTDADLAKEIKLLEDALAAKDLGDGDLLDKLTQGAALHGLTPADLIGKASGGGFNDAVLQSELDKYRKEKSERDKLPADHPRRSGNDPGTGSYPILFEFEHRAGDGVTAGGGQLAEGVGKGSVDMKGALVRAFAPFARLAEFAAAIQPTFPTDVYEVVPLEAYERLPKAEGNGQMMWDTIAKIQKSQNVMHALRDAKTAGGKKDST